LRPATSTIGEIVKRAGLVVERKTRRRTEPYTEPLAHADESNRVWCMRLGQYVILILEVAVRACELATP